jgi:PncC family amidohydrolase
VSTAAIDDVRRIAEEVAALLLAGGETLATAESCTGGVIVAALTAVPGASNFLWGGGVVYSEDAKIGLAGVEAEVLRQHGPVSAPTTAALAVGMRRRAGTTYGLAVTGWAGPTAAVDGEVGDVYGAVSYPEGVDAGAWRFDGDRTAVRTGAATAALDLLRRHLAGAQDGADD